MSKEIEALRQFLRGKERMAWSEWVLDQSRDGTFFTDSNENLTAEYYLCKEAFFAGYERGKKYEHR